LRALFFVFAGSEYEPMDTRTPKTPFDPERERWLNELIAPAEGAKIQSTSVDNFKARAAKDGALIKLSERVHRVRRRYAYGL
jgi:hypothetical protein